MLGAVRTTRVVRSASGILGRMPFPDMREEPLRDLPEVLTLEQCADVLQVSVATMRSLISDGTVPAFRLGARTTRIYRDELICAIEDARIQGAKDGEESPGG